MEMKRMIRRERRRNPVTEKRAQTSVIEKRDHLNKELAEKRVGGEVGAVGL